MQNKNIQTNIKPLLFALVLLVGVTLSTAQSIWNNAPANQSTGVPVPITLGYDGEVKKGMLVTSGITNNIGPIISFSNMNIGSSSEKTPTYFFGETYFKKPLASSGIENQVCIDPAGKVKICDIVEFSPVKNKYSTADNVTTFKDVKGYVSYKTGSLTCTTQNLAGTDWGGRTISGTSASDQVTFSGGWGTYDLKMDCGGKTYTASIDIGGKIQPTTVGSKITYNLNFGSTKTIYIEALGAGGGSADETANSNGTSSKCYVGYKGGATSVTIGSSSPKTVVDVYGGTGGQYSFNNTYCTSKVGDGGTVKTNSLDYPESHDGYRAAGWNGGCSGMPDLNGKSNWCTSSTWAPSVNAGNGAGFKSSTPVYAAGGGGGAFAAGYYDLPQNTPIIIYIGERGKSVGSNGSDGDTGYVKITW